MKEIKIALFMAAFAVPATAAHPDITGSLKKHLLESYNKMNRPVTSFNESVNILLALNLYQVLDVGEIGGSIKLYMWNRQMWHDHRLGWDPKKYNGTSKISLPHSIIWLPDFFLYNGYEISESYTVAYISTVPVDPSNPESEYTGLVRFMFPAIYRFSCDFQVQYFPFDRQNCSLQFGSWIHDSSEIKYIAETDHVRMESFIGHPEWNYVSFDMREEYRPYNCCADPYSEIHCHLVIRRKPLYYLVNLILPTIVITCISMFGFFTPVSSSGERTEKVNLGVTTLMAMAVLLMVVSEQMPTTSNFVPLIKWFYLSNMFLIAFGTFLTSVIIMVQQRGHLGKEVPETVRWLVFDHLAPFVCMTPPASWRYELKRKKTIAGTNIKAGIRKLALTPEPVRIKVTLGSPDMAESHSDKSGSDINGNKTPNSTRSVEQSIKRNGMMMQIGFAGITKQLKCLNNMVRQMKSSHELSEKQAAIMIEWEIIATVLDKILLIIFMFLIFLTVAIFFAVGILHHD